MSVRRILIHHPPPSYSQANASDESTFCEAFVDAFRDPVLVLITLATAIGSFCLLSGLILLCVVSKTVNDQTSEAILLMGMGFFVSAVACITWKLTNRTRIKQMLDAIKEEAV